MAITTVGLTINITADLNANSGGGSTPSNGSGGGTAPGSMPSTPITSNRREAEFKHPTREKRDWAGWGSFVTYTHHDNESEGEAE